MNARTGSVPWDLSGRAKTPEEYKAWLEERERQRADKDAISRHPEQKRERISTKEKM